MTPYTEPTAEQIAAAQAAGDAAYAEAERNGAPLTTCYDAYRAAYEAERDRQETNAAPRPGYIVNQAAQLWGWMGDDEITTGQIAELEARTAETANETEDSR